MKNLNIKNLLMALPPALLLGFSACKLDEIENPNAPDQTALENGGATLNDLRLLAVGLESVLRVDIEQHMWTLNIVGREYWDLRATDPRYIGRRRPCVSSAEAQ